MPARPRGATVRRFIQTGKTHATEGSSIGAAMRALPFGWVTPVAAADRRRDLTIRLSETTHGARAAIMSACVVASMAAWAIEQHRIEAVVTAGLREADHLAKLYALDPAILRPLRQAADGHWGPHEPGRPLDAVATVASVLHVLQEATELGLAMKSAVALGGDTDTTAAMIGGILGCRLEDVESEIRWLDRIVLPKPETVEATVAGLSELRRQRHP